MCLILRILLIFKPNRNSQYSISGVLRAVSVPKGRLTGQFRPMRAKYYFIRPITGQEIDELISPNGGAVREFSSLSLR